MENKIKRLIELSREFTVGREEVYGDNPSISLIGNGLTLNYCSTQTVSKTQLETFEENTTKRVEKARRYEEYLTLQTDLSNYYNALTKLK